MIWCIEDEKGIRDLEIYTLNSVGIAAKGFEDAATAYKALETEKPELIILDIMLPGMNGEEFLKKLKSMAGTKDIPVIMASAKGREYDKIRDLDLGADDYLVKPFGMLEMVSRIKAVLRRRGGEKPAAEVLKSGDLNLDLTRRTAEIKGEKIPLTYKEFELLKVFLKNPGTAHTREKLFFAVWGSGYMGDSRTLDMHIKTLRRKLKEYGKCIETVRNVGYRWEAEND